MTAAKRSGREACGTEPVVDPAAAAASRLDIRLSRLPGPPENAPWSAPVSEAADVVPRTDTMSFESKLICCVTVARTVVEVPVAATVPPTSVVSAWRTAVANEEKAAFS